MIEQRSEYRFSIIMPAFNAESYITEAITSVVNQSESSWELIIIDDGSTDDTQKIVEHFSNRNIQYIYQENAGPAVARRNGVKKSTGEYIVFLDSDDRLRPDALQRMGAMLDEHPAACLSYGDEIFMTEAGEVMGSEKKPRYAARPSGFVLHDLMMGNFIFNGASCVRKSHLDAVDLNFNGLINEDWVLWCHLAAIADFQYIGPDPVLEYRLRSNSLSRTFGRDLEATMQAIDVVFNSKTIKEKVPPVVLRKLRRKREAVAYAFSAKHAASARQWWTAAKYAFNAVYRDLLNPFSPVLPRHIARLLERRRKS